MTVFFPLQRGDGGFLVLQAVEVFREEQPGGLLGVIELAGATGVLPEDVIDVFEDLFEHVRDVGEKAKFEEQAGMPVSR